MIKINKSVIGFILLINLLIDTTLAFADENNTALNQQAILASTSHSANLSVPTQASIQQALLQASQQEGEITTAPVGNKTVIYPIHSTKLTPGKIIAQMPLYLNLKQPIFLVGNDDFSYQWLAKNAVQLQKIHAIGFLVEAQSEQDYQQIKNLIGDIPLIPLSADAFAVAWHLNHYPVLISSHEIEQ